MSSFVATLAFLTILPLSTRKLPSPEIIARARFWYPVVGLLLGALLGGATALLAAWIASSTLAAFLILLAWVGVTGALHIDGLCDLCDGLFGGHTPEDRLRIMKDPHVGTFGLVGCVLLLLGKFVVLSELIRAVREQAGWYAGSAVVLARCLALCLAAGARYPRPEGTGRILIEATRRWEFVLFAALGFTAAWMNPIPFAPAILAVVGLRWLCQRRLGGITGDCLGAGIEIVELVYLSTIVANFTLKG